MKKFLFRLFLAALIGLTIYFFISGNSISDLTSKDGPISRSGFVELKDQVLGGFSVENSDIDEDIEDFVTSTLDSISGSESSEDSGDGPLSNLLDNFRSEDETAEDNQDNDADDENLDQEERSIDEIESNTNLPEFNLVCFPEIKRECNFEGCETVNPDINFTLINSDEGLVHQCSLEECKTFQYEGREYSNSYNYQIQSSDEMYMISRELEPDNSGRTAYAEMRARGVNTSINLGRCLGK